VISVVSRAATIGNWLRRIAIATCCAMCLTSGATAQVADPLAEFLAQLDGEYGKIKQSVQSGRQRFAEVAQALDDTAAFFAGASAMAPDQRDEWRKRFEDVRALLKAQSSVLAKFDGYAQLVGQATDAADEVSALYESLSIDQTIDRLRALVSDAIGGGANAAQLDGAVAALAAARLGLITAADRLRKQSVVIRDQSELRSVLYGGEQDPRYRQLSAQYGADFANQTSFRPSTPREVFRPSPSDKAADLALIWDEQQGEWYRLKGEVPLEKMFQEAYVALSRRPTPGQLKFFAENFAQVKTREATAETISNYLGATVPGRSGLTEIFAGVREAPKMSAVLKDPELFRKKFVYDAQFRNWTLDVLDQMRRNFISHGAMTDRAELDALVARHGITLESQWAEGVVPASATVRVVAWFSDNPKNKFRSVWHFEKEKVTIDIDNGHGYGVRGGNVVRSEGSLPAHNCTASDVRTFKPGGQLTFEAVYTCALDDGATRIENVSGAGTWEMVSPRTTVRGKAKR
jgi:hypothetical protein